MNLQARIATMKFAHRDVKISLDGTLVLQREEALAAVKAAGDEVRKVARSLKLAQNLDTADERLGKATEYPELEQAILDAQEELKTATAAVDEVEDRMRADLTTFRVTALPKDRFNELRIEAQGNPSKLYSSIARESITYISDAGDEEAIDSATWDQLEPAMTEGQWQPLVEAIDELNIVAGRERRDFLGRGSQATQS